MKWKLILLIGMVIMTMTDVFAVSRMLPGFPMTFDSTDNLTLDTGGSVTQGMFFENNNIPGSTYAGKPSHVIINITKDDNNVICVNRTISYQMNFSQGSSSTDDTNALSFTNRNSSSTVSLAFASDYQMIGLANTTN